MAKQTPAKSPAPKGKAAPPKAPPAKAAPAKAAASKAAAGKPNDTKPAKAAASEPKGKAAATAGKPVKGAKVAPPKPGSAPNALQKPLKPSPELAVVVGSDSLPRGEVVSKVWTYIKEKNLQNPQNKREILADDALGKVFGKDRVTMFEMNKHLARHLT